MKAAFPLAVLALLAPIPADAALVCPPDNTPAVDNKCPGDVVPRAIYKPTETGGNSGGSPGANTGGTVIGGSGTAGNSKAEKPEAVEKFSVPSGKFNEFAIPKGGKMPSQMNKGTPG